jgi:hypothetical protein
VNETPQTNGKQEEAVAGALVEDSTVGYIPTIPLEALWEGGTDSPKITMRRDIEFMMMHDVVITGVDYYKSGISGTEFWGGPDPANPQNDQGKPISPDSRVAQFVLTHAQRFWQTGVPLWQEGGYIYGWAPGEHIYREVGGYMVWSYMKDFHPNDGFVLTHSHRPIGLRIKNIRNPVGETLEERREREAREAREELAGKKMGGTVDLWFASAGIPAKASWYPHRPHFGQFYGRSQLAGGWRPWRRLGWRDAVEQVIDAAVYRAGYRGPIVRHPAQDMQTAQVGAAATRVDGSGGRRRPAREVAQQLVEWAKAGAGFTLSSAKYPPTMGGGNQWDIEWPDHVMDVRPLIEAARYLEDKILLGIGVPPELVRAGGTGSGYSGRSVPRESFLVGQQHIANNMLQIFVDQVIRPLVLWNFGDVPFEIQCKSLLKSQADDKRGEQPGGGGTSGGPSGGGNQNKNYNRSQAAKDAWRRRKINEPNSPQQNSVRDLAQAMMSNDPPAVAANEDLKRRVLEVVRRVAMRGVA